MKGIKYITGIDPFNHDMPEQIKGYMEIIDISKKGINDALGIPVAIYHGRPDMPNRNTIEARLEFLRQTLHHGIDINCYIESYALDRLYDYIYTFGHPHIKTSTTVMWYKYITGTHDRHIKDRLLHGSW